MGRRWGLKNPWWVHHVGSNPTFGTIIAVLLSTVRVRTAGNPASEGGNRGDSRRLDFKG